MIVFDVKSRLTLELSNAESIWIATAMISYTGWKLIQQSLPKKVKQNFLIGIDLATDPKVFEHILSNLDINARVYQTNYTFHPKVYLIRKVDNSFVAIIGSSNTTSWGLEKNVEMNYLINDQHECKKLQDWFNEYYQKGYLITESFVFNYKAKFNRIAIKSSEIAFEKKSLNNEMNRDNEQFFSMNNHEIFQLKYHRRQTDELKFLRKEVSDKFLKIHKTIYPQFKDNGLEDIHCHHNPSQIVSRHYFNRFSGNFINAMWLHYGKSFTQLEKYKTTNKSVNRSDSFINNIRMQVIIHSDHIGIWLVLGKDNGSKHDRNHFREQMKDPKIRTDFYYAIKKLNSNYWINIHGIPPIEDLKNPEELYIHIQKEDIDKYFIIGCDINWLDQRLSTANIYETILQEFKKLYPLYEIMRHT